MWWRLTSLVTKSHWTISKFLYQYMLYFVKVGFFRTQFVVLSKWVVIWLGRERFEWWRECTGSEGLSGGLGEYGEWASKGVSIHPSWNSDDLWDWCSSRPQQCLQCHHFPSQCWAWSDQASICMHFNLSDWCRKMFVEVHMDTPLMELWRIKFGGFLSIMFSISIHFKVSKPFELLNGFIKNFCTKCFEILDLGTLWLEHRKSFEPFLKLFLFAILCSFRDPQLIKRIGDATALEVRATGIPYVFAPCIAVNKTVDTVS